MMDVEENLIMKDWQIWKALNWSGPESILWATWVNHIFGIISCLHLTNTIILSPIHSPPLDSQWLQTFGTRSLNKISLNPLNSQLFAHLSMSLMHYPWRKEVSFGSGWRAPSFFISGDGGGVVRTPAQNFSANFTAIMQIVGLLIRMTRIDPLCPLELRLTSGLHNFLLCVEESMWAPDDGHNVCGQCNRG